MAIPWTCLVVMILCGTGLGFVACDTDPGDTSVLRALMKVWKKTPPTWGKSDDPCGSQNGDGASRSKKNWDGVHCENSRVVKLALSSMGLIGTLTSDIADLTELQILDLSSNRNLTGSIPAAIGRLTKLQTLILAGCGFTGDIPAEMGDLTELTYLALNTNGFTGSIPPSLGNLVNVLWLDLAENQLNGTIPVSTAATPGLDLLVRTEHFHFNKNNLSGSIPEKLFSSQMNLKHLLFDGNQLTGEIPSTLGLVKNLTALRLDRNYLNGTVPSNLNNLTKIIDLHLSNNMLTGPVPNLTGMNSLSYVDLSNNSFDVSEAPIWFSTIQSLTTLVVEHGPFQGLMPPELFSFPKLQTVNLKNNLFNGTLDISNLISQQLQLIDFQNNDIAAITLGPPGANSLKLFGTPVCQPTSPSNSYYCGLSQWTKATYSTNMSHCDTESSCSDGLRRNPRSCQCAYPYEGQMVFRAAPFTDLSKNIMFELLESDLYTKLNLTSTLQDIFFDPNYYLQLRLQLFPSSGKYFDRADISRIGFQLSNQTYKPPEGFGPYFFIASPYPFPYGSPISKAVTIAIAVCSVVLVFLLTWVGIYGFRLKKRAERAIEISRPFAAWAPNGKDTGGAPQLKGARWFSFDELKKCTDGFSKINEIGSGGYGKVYRGMLTGGQMVAIKRAQQGSVQGAHEFKTEIELLSRVHHKNLVSLVGFCFEQGEQMLVYEYIPNGTLRESLSGRTGFNLDWKRRLLIALGSARGLTYLHELANPPIIHRDVKTANILLDGNLNAKVADFGLSKPVSDSAKGHVSSQVKGTLGYLDPEYYMTHLLTDKSDVYSFGVVMLELATAKKPIDKDKYIVRDVQTLMNTNKEHYGFKEIMDPDIWNATNVISFRRFVHLAMQCVGESAAERPTMSEVVKEIEILLQNEGVNAHSDSASSSEIDFGSLMGGPHHPYNEELTRRERSSDSFYYSGGFSYSAKVEPK